jgi:hypothetical protein
MNIQWFRIIFILFNLIAIPILVILAAIVYDRMAIEVFSPPVYSIWTRPGETWHRAELVLSPSFGFQITIDGSSIVSYKYSGNFETTYQKNDRWNTVDRPRLAASYLEIPSGLEAYYWTFANTGTEDATNIRLNIATVDLHHARHSVLTIPLNVLPRLKRGMAYSVTTAPENDLEFLTVCLTYNNDRGTAFVDPPEFYLTPFYMKANRETRLEPARVIGLLYDQLSAGFSCAKL